MHVNLKLLIGIFVLVVSFPLLVASQTSGPNSPGAGTNVNVTGNSWSNPNNVTASDDSWTSVSLSTTQTSDALVATNFGFSIPGTATIDGITVSIERFGTITITIFPFRFTYIRDYTIQLTKDGSNPIGNNKASGSIWPTTDGSATYGNATDLWGTTWTPAEINSSNFGVYIRAESWNAFGTGSETANVDHVTVTIDYSIPTPVELISFDGEVIEEVIELKWQTTWEVNNDFFTIEKSANGLNYLELAIIDGNGSTELISDYSYIDPLPFEGNNYYRLAQTDFDGIYEVFKPIMVKFDRKGSMLKIYPNPVHNDYVNLVVNPDLLKGENNNTYILIRSITGEVVHQQPSTITLGNKISLNKRFESGVYILELHSPYGESSEKLIVK